MFNRVCLSLLALSLMLGAGCKGETTIDDVEGWIRAGQMSKMREFVANPESPMGLRVQSVQKLVEYGQTTEVQNVIEEVKDREAFVAACVKSLEEGLKNDAIEVQVESKEALFIFLNQVPEDRQGEIQKTIADWAFAGLSEKSTRQEVTSRIEQTRLIGQLGGMGQYGIPAAALLVSYGVETQSLQNYLAEAEQPETQRAVIRAVQKLLTMKDLMVPWEILDITRHFAIPETVEMLVDVYLNQNFPDGARSSGLAAAQGLIYGIEVKEGVSVTDTPEKRKVVMAALDKLLRSTIATDRWDTAEMMLYIDGLKALDRVMSGLKADIGSYVRFTPEGDQELPDYVIIGLCNERLRPKASEARPVLEAWLTKGDAAQKAISTLCLKVLAEEESLPALRKATSGNESLETFFFSGKERALRKPLIADSRIPELTTGLLAQNAIDGIAYLGEIDMALAGGKMDKEEAQLRQISALAVIALTGEAYKKAVDKTYDKKKAHPDAPDTAAENTPENPPQKPAETVAPKPEKVTAPKPHPRRRRRSGK